MNETFSSTNLGPHLANSLFCCGSRNKDVIVSLLILSTKVKIIIFVAVSKLSNNGLSNIF
jgi:hypothetical protein